jgi:microcompartment protein CcmL/EutN
VQGVSDVKFFDALGVMEFYSLTSAVCAADAAVKSGLIELIEIRLGMAIGGKAFVTLTGDVGSVKAAIDAGRRASMKEGLLLESVVIPSPNKELYYKLL